MPVYCYKCNTCKKSFEVKHSMSFEDQKCLFCESLNIFRIPSIQTNKIFSPYSNSQKPGKVVEEYIKNSKKELKKEKQKLKREEL